MTALIGRCKLRVRERLSTEFFVALDGNVLDMIIREVIDETRKSSSDDDQREHPCG